MSWLKPYLRTWYQAYPDSVPPAGQIAHAVKALLKAHTEIRIAEELAAYLRKTPHQYVSLPRFVATFGSWNVQPPSERKSLGPSYLSVDECDRRAGIPVK